ncbi:MAG: PorP/SprF family type IX secretion system membrane protein [Flavobacteriia bacterium]|nr:PorP/SprF family type IX secretion system membrane protein [Flavobacteriia bacterium]
MKNLYFILIFVNVLVVHSQDIHFSQTSQSPLLINPGCAGVFDGWERVNLNQRNQWMGATTQYMTTNFSADANFFKSTYNDKAHLGVGFQFNNDMGGDSKFGSQNGSLTLNGILPLSKGHILSVGLQGGFGSRKGDISNLTFENQWNGEIFDPTINSGEVNNLNSFKYADISSGIYYVYDSKKTTFARHNESKIQLGFSVFHINTPKLQYVVSTSDFLHRKFVLHGSIIKDILETKWSVDASFLQFIQGGHYQTILGSMFKYRFKNGTKITGFNQDAFFGFGLYMRVKDAIIPSFMVDVKSFRLGLSYDVTISQLRRAYGGGSFEISLTYTNLNNFLTKKRH